MGEQVPHLSGSGNIESFCGIALRRCLFVWHAVIFVALVVRGQVFIIKGCNSIERMYRNPGEFCVVIVFLCQSGLGEVKRQSPGSQTMSLASLARHCPVCQLYFHVLFWREEGQTRGRRARCIWASIGEGECGSELGHAAGKGQRTGRSVWMLQVG